MGYLGGKHVLARQFAPVLVEALAAAPTTLLVEPFVGGFNVLPRLRQAGYSGPALCADLHRGVVVLYEALRRGWQPPETVTEAQWKAARDHCSWEDPLCGFLAFHCAFNGMEWKAFARDSSGRTDYVARARRALLRKVPAMVDTTFAHADYRSLDVPDGCVVYADPPYRGTVEYFSVPGFDHEAFYRWCESTAARARVLVSEFTVPTRPGWEPIWSVERKVFSRGRMVTDYLVEVHPQVPGPGSRR